MPLLSDFVTMEAVEPIVGLTQDRWDLLLVAAAVLLFAAGVLVATRL